MAPRLLRNVHIFRAFSRRNGLESLDRLTIAAAIVQPFHAWAFGYALPPSVALTSATWLWLRGGGESPTGGAGRLGRDLRLQRQWLGTARAAADLDPGQDTRGLSTLALGVPRLLCRPPGRVGHHFGGNGC